MWDKVFTLEKGEIYVGGTIDQFQKLTGWTGHKVMYFGDHPYADLADVTLHHGWSTAAVIRELEAEIMKMNTDEFKWGVNWQQVGLYMYCNTRLKLWGIAFVTDRRTENQTNQIRRKPIFIHKADAFEECSDFLCG